MKLNTAHPGPTLMFHERLESLRHHFTHRGGVVTLLGQGANSWSDVLTQIETISAERGLQLEELSVAFFAYEDYRGAELISLCLEKGLQVPENVAVLGVDNDDLINDGLAIGLSSVDSDQEGLGREGARLLRGLMEDQKTPVATGEIMRHQPRGIITRKSTDCYAVRSPLVASALHWIHHHFHRGIQAIDVARAMTVTQQGLQKAFSANHLRTPGREIRYQRVRAAEYQVTHSTVGLSEIAKRCGYYSVDNLISSFRKEFGTTPIQYRKKMKRGN